MSNWTPIVERLEGPLYLTIANPLTAAVERGELTPGTRLPTQRDLATSRASPRPPSPGCVPATSWRRSMPDARHPHGLHVWPTLPEQWRAEVLVSEARLRNVAITPAVPFVVEREAAAPNAVRLSIGAARTAAQLRQGLEILADILTREPEPFYMPT